MNKRMFKVGLVFLLVFTAILLFFSYNITGGKNPYLLKKEVLVKKPLYFDIHQTTVNLAAASPRFEGEISIVAQSMPRMITPLDRKQNEIFNVLLQSNIVSYSAAREISRTTKFDEKGQIVFYPRDNSSATSFELVARVVNHEAGNTNKELMKGVGNTIINRYNIGLKYPSVYSSDIKEIIFDKKQYSCIYRDESLKPYSLEVFQAVLEMCQESDNTGGAVEYTCVEDKVDLLKTDHRYITTTIGSSWYLTNFVGIADEYFSSLTPATASLERDIPNLS